MIKRKITFLSTLLVFIMACSSSTKSDTDLVGDAMEVKHQDLQERDSTKGEETEDIQNDLEVQDVAQDTNKTYSMIEQGWPKPPTENPKKFAVAVFHYNIQYVAGGLKGFMPGKDFDLDNDQVEDRIVTQGLAPLLDILLEHPAFAVDIEMQGYMLDVIRERFPDVLKKLRTLIKRGQVEIMSFHYSDQLFVAHPAWSMKKSIELNKRAFKAAGIPVADSVFTQEGQFSEGMLEMMKLQGQHIGVLKNNLYKYVLGRSPDALLYTMRGQDVVTTESMKDADTGIEVNWWAVDDGEVLMAGKKNPYLGLKYISTPQDREKVIKKFQDIVDKGYFLTLVTDYVRRIKKDGVKAKELKFMLDGTWHPTKSNNLFAWMGRRGVFGKNEADNDVMTSLERSRIQLMALEKVMDAAKKNGVNVTDYEGDFWSAVRDQVLGEVSDATGWNPWKGEVDYGLNHSQSAFDKATQLIKEIVKKAWNTNQVMVDLDTGTVMDQLPGSPSKPGSSQGVDPQWDVHIDADGFKVTTNWYQLKDKGDGVYLLKINLKKQDDTVYDAKVSFELKTDRLIYSPAMLENEVETISLDDIATDPFTVGLANGLIGLGDDTFLIEDTRSVHLAAFVSKSKDSVWFEDQTINRQAEVTYNFYLLKDTTPDKAKEFARKLNVVPQVIVP